MKKLLLCLCIAVTSVTMSAAQKVPKFSGYPAKVEKPRITKIDFKKNPDARTYKTRLSEGLREGINFAGHFVIVGWGCGTGCTNAAVIDTFTGKVHWPEEFYNVDARYPDEYSDVQLDFRKNSRLLIIHGRPGTANENGYSGPAGDYYFEWRNNRLQLLKSVPKSE
jgi:hypothetical protein